MIIIQLVRCTYLLSLSFTLQVSESKNFHARVLQNFSKVNLNGATKNFIDTFLAFDVPSGVFYGDGIGVQDPPSIFKYVNVTLCFY